MVYTLSNGVIIPDRGFGTFKLEKGYKTRKAVLDAIKVGYRLIDCAPIYENEADVGTAIRDCDVDRKELFITSKIWNDALSYNQTVDAVKKQIKDLKCDYLDLCLIHFPSPFVMRGVYNYRNIIIWKALEDMYDQGLIRALGVSNFMEHHLEALRPFTRIPIMLNQMEFNPFYYDKDALEYCRRHNIVVESHSTIGRGTAVMLEEVKYVARKYKKTPAQICIRYCMDMGVIPLAKSKQPCRISENFNVDDFKLKNNDIDFLKSLNCEFNRISSWPDICYY